MLGKYCLIEGGGMSEGERNVSKEYEFLIIGAGMAGLLLAARLEEAGKRVAVVEKARGSGGRLSSKRLQTGAEEYSFDLGCSSFTLEQDRSISALQLWCQDGLGTISDADKQPRYVGIPRNSALTRQLANRVEVHFQSRAISLAKKAGKWEALIECRDNRQQRMVCEKLILATPAPQAADLLPAAHPLQDKLASFSLQPQWVVLWVSNDPYVDRFLETPPNCIEAVSREDCKPERKDYAGEKLWQIQLKADWTRSRCDWQPEAVKAHLADLLKRNYPESFGPKLSYAHRWLYSFSEGGKRQSEAFGLSGDGIALCGDYWLADGRHDGVESAISSALELAEVLLDRDSKAESRSDAGALACHTITP